MSPRRNVARYCLAGALLLLAIWLLAPREGGLRAASAPFMGYIPYVGLDNTPTPPPTPTPTATPPGWTVQYYDNEDLSGAPVAVRYETYDYPAEDWAKDPPLAGMPKDDFSIRFTTDKSLAAGEYAFYVTSDDGCRLSVDGTLVIDEWHTSPLGTATYRWAGTLTAGMHHLVLEYYDTSGDAMVRLQAVNTATFPQWRAEYYNNDKLSGEPVLVRNDTELQFDWGSNSPGPGVNQDNFSVRWTGALHLNEGQYVLLEENRGGARVWVNRWAEDREVIDDWSVSGSKRTATAYFHAKVTGWYMFTVTYRKHTGSGRMRFNAIYGGAKEFFVGEYYKDQDLSELYTVRQDLLINFAWGTGRPMDGMPRDHFSVRWLKCVEFAGGTYRFTADFDDGARVWVDDREVIDEWNGGAHNGVTGDISLSAGWHAVIMEYYEDTGDAFARLSWEQTSASLAEGVGTPGDPLATPTALAPR
jgi:hypothetical protein